MGSFQGLGSEISDKVRLIIKNASRRLHGAERREHIAEITSELLNGNVRKAERVFGWGRETIKKGMNELSASIRCVDNYPARGNRKTEEKIPGLVEDIQSITDPGSQAAPRLETPFAYTRITAKAVRKALIDVKRYTNEQLPCENTIGNILNRSGYRLKRVQKTKPVKKIPETDAIFANIYNINNYVNNSPQSLRISIDTKAKLDIGEFSRNGKTRELKPENGLDHDVSPDAKLVPFGLLEPSTNNLSIIYGTSIETSDFIVDCLELWWNKNEFRHSNVEELIINLDNGPQIQSRRTQFIKRIVEFTNNTGLTTHLVYYPPYHSKYNPIERCWGVLEEHWNGTLLSSISKAIKWTETMTWRGIHPAVYLLDKDYETGVTLTKEEMQIYENMITRSEKLSRWDVTINPTSG